MPSILFVCTANVCRSPMAAGLFQHKLATLPNYSHWRVESAGTWGLDGKPAVKEVQELLRERGIDLSQHRARTVNLEMIRSFDLVLTMEENHKEALKAEFPQFAKKIFLLSEMIGALFDIHDPIGKSMNEYKRAEELVDRILEDGNNRIQQLARRYPTVPVVSP